MPLEQARRGFAEARDKDYSTIRRTSRRTRMNFPQRLLFRGKYLISLQFSLP